MLHMFFKGKTINNDVIEIDYHNLIKVGAEDLALEHAEGEGDWGICEPKGHHLELICPIPSHTNCLWLISFCDPYLIGTQS